MFLHTVDQECFESLLSILHWSWTTLVLGVEELRGLKGFQFTATLLDLERLRFVGTCCLRLLRVYTCEIYPVSGMVNFFLKSWKQIISEIKKINVQIAKCLRWQNTFKLLLKLSGKKMLILNYIYQTEKSFTNLDLNTNDNNFSMQIFKNYFLAHIN